MSSADSSVVIKYDREQTRALYQKATSLGSAVFKNKSSFISDVDVVWFGGQNDSFPFVVDKELNLSAQMPHQQVLDKFKSAIFEEPPAVSGISTVKVRSTLCGYVVLKRVNDSKNNVLKTVELLFERKWVGVVHMSDGAKLYLLPTSSLTHHLGITSPDYVYPRILHGLFVRKEKKVKQSVTSGSTPSSFVATPLPLHQSQASLAGLLAGDDKPTQAPPTSATVVVATAKSTPPKKRKFVSFADLPSSSNVEDKDDIIITSQVPATVRSPATILTASSTGSDTKGEATVKVDTPQVVIPKVTITPGPAPPKISIAAASKGGGGNVTITSLQEAEKTVSDDRSLLVPSPLREILSDEESIASSTSSLTSDSMSLLDQPTRRKRGGRRRGAGRGKKATTLVQDERVREEADIHVGGGQWSPKPSKRGGRGRRRGGRGARSGPPELTRSFSVEVVEDSLKAEVAEKTLYDLLQQDSVSITQVEQNDEKPVAATPAPEAAVSQSPSTPHATSPVEEEEMDIVTLPQKGKSEIKAVQLLTKLPDTCGSRAEEEMIVDDDSQQDSIQPQATATTAQADQTSTAPTSADEVALEHVESLKGKEILQRDIASNETPAGMEEEESSVAKEQDNEEGEREKEGSAEIEQEVISQDGALGHMDEFIVMDSGGGQYVRPPKRVTLAEYIKRRKVTDSTSSELSQSPSEREAVIHAKPSTTRLERTATLDTSTDIEAERSTQRSPTAEAISEALKAEIIGLKGQVQLEKKARDVEIDSVVKSKEGTSLASEKTPSSRQLSPILPPLPLKKIDVHAAGEQSKSDTATTQPSKIPVSSRVTPQQSHRFNSPISTPLPPSHPTTFPSMIQPHPTAPSHPTLPTQTAQSAAAAAQSAAAAAASYYVGSYSHLFFPQAAAAGIGAAGLTQPQDHWPFGHQFFPSGATAASQSASALDFQNSLRSLGFDDVPPPPPSALRSPDSLMSGPLSRSITHDSRSRSRSRTRSPSRSRSQSRSRSRSRGRSRSVSRSPRSVSRSRSRSRSPLVMRPRSRRSRSVSRSRSRNNKSPRRSRGRGMSRSRTPSTPEHERLTSAMMLQLSEHLSAHLLQTMQVQEDKQKKEFGVQASPSIFSVGTQIGTGFKLRSVSSQTQRPARRVSRGIQCSSRKRGMGIQTDPPDRQSTFSQTHIKKRTIGCQTGSFDASGASSSNVVDVLIQDSGQDFSEFTEIFENAKKKFADAIGLTLDDLSDDEHLFDVSSSPEETSSVDVQEERDRKEEDEKKEDGEGDMDANTSLPMAPSPVISGASNISDGEWSDLEGSPNNSNSRKPSESSTPTQCVSTDGAGTAVPAQLQEVFDTLQGHPANLKDVVMAKEEPSSTEPKSLTPTPVSPPLRLTTPSPPSTSAYNLDCESPSFCSPVSMVISPVAESDIDEILIEEQKKSEMEASKRSTKNVEGCPTTSKPSIPVVELGKQSKGQSTASEADSVSSKRTTDTSSEKEPKQKRSSTPIDMFGPSLPPGLPETTTAYGPALPPSNSTSEPRKQSSPATDAAASAYGPPLPPPRASYDVPLPPIYGPALPPTATSGGGSKSPLKSSDGTGEVQVENDGGGPTTSESQGHRESNKDKEEEVTTDSQESWTIRSISLPPFKMSGGSSSNSNSGRSTPLVSNKSTPLSSPGEDSSRSSEPQAKHHQKSVSPQSVSRTVSSEKSKHEPSTSAKPASDGRKRQQSSGRDSNEQTFKSPRKRRRSRRHDSPDERRSRGQESLKEKRTKKGSSSDDSSDGGNGSSAAASEPKSKSRPDTLTTKKLQEAFESSSLIENVRKAASSSPPSSNSKKFGSDPVLFPVKKKPVLTAQELLEKVRAKKLHIKSPEETYKTPLGQQGSPASTPLSPSCSIGQGSILLSPTFTSHPPGSQHDSPINIQELMMKFHQHMAAKKNVGQDSSWVHHGVPGPPPPFVGPLPPPAHAPPPYPIQPLPPLPPRAPTTGSGIGDPPPSIPSTSSATINMAATDGDSDDDIDAQLEAVMDSHITEMRSKSHSPSKVSQQASSTGSKESVLSSRVSSSVPPSLEQLVSKGRDSSSSSRSVLALLSSEQSAIPASSEHFLAAELVQHSSSEESGTVEPAVTMKATVDSHSPRNKTETTKTKGTFDKCDARERAKSADPSAISDQLEGPPSPSIEQQSQANSILNSDVLPITEAAASASKHGVKSVTASTPDRPTSIMYQSSVLDPVSPTGLSDDSPTEASVGQSMSASRVTIEQEESSKHTVPEHNSGSSIAVLEATKVSSSVTPPQEKSICSETEKKDKTSVDGERDEARVDAGDVSTREAVTLHHPDPDPEVSTAESGDAVSDQQGECSKDTPSELVGSTGQQHQASCDTCTPSSDDAASKAKPADTAEQVGNVATQIDTVSSRGTCKKGDKECQKVMEVEIESRIEDDGCSSGQPDKLLTQQFPPELGASPGSGSSQPLAAGTIIDVSKVQNDAQGQITHDNVTEVTTISKSLQETTNTDSKADTSAGTERQESDREVSESMPASVVPQLSPPPLVVEQQRQEEHEVIAQTEDTSGSSQKQEKEVQETESQSVSEKHDKEREEDLKSTNSAPLLEDSKKDLHLAPEEDLGGRESRDPSPEIFRGDGNEEAPELTDISGEDFVVSRSPSFSPLKLPFSSPTRKITSSAIDEIVCVRTCALPSIDAQRSNFELSDNAPDTDVFTHLKDSVVKEQSFSDAARRSSSTTSSNWDPFADSAESSPLQSPGVSSESPESQVHVHGHVPPSAKEAPNTAKSAIGSSAELMLGGSADSNNPPLQSPDLSSTCSSSEKQAFPTVQLTPEAVDSVEPSLVSGDAPTSVVNEAATGSQIEQLSVLGEMDTENASEDHTSQKESTVREAESKTDTKGSDERSDEILVNDSPTTTCTPLGELQSIDTSPALFESVTIASSEMEEKAAKVPTAIQESESIAREGGEGQETDVTSLLSAQLSSPGAAGETMHMETKPNELKVTIAMNTLPEAQTTTLSESNAPPTAEAAPTSVSLAPPSTTPTSCSVSQAPPTESVRTTSTFTTVSSSSDSVVPVSFPGVPSSTSLVTSSAKSVTSLSPAVQTTPTLRSLSYKAVAKSRKPKTRIVPPRSCNTNKTSPDDNPALVVNAPVDLTASAATVSSHPNPSLPLKLQPSQPHSSASVKTLKLKPSQPHSSAPTITAETLKLKPSQPHSSAPTITAKNLKLSPSQPQSSAPTITAETLKLKPSQPHSSAPAVTAETLMNLLHALCKSIPNQPVYLTFPGTQSPHVTIEALVAASPSLLNSKDGDATAVTKEDNKECSGDKGGESSRVSDKGEELPKASTVSGESVSESGLSDVEKEASTTDQQLHCGTDISKVDNSQPSGQESEQDASSAKTEASPPGDGMELSEELTNTDPTPPSCPEEKNDTSIKMHVDPSEAQDKIENSSIPTRLDHSESSDNMAEGTSLPTQHEHNESSEAEDSSMPTQLEHHESRDKIDSCSMQAQVELPDTVRSSCIERADIQLASSEPLPTGEDSPVSSPLPPPSASTIAAPSTGEREESDMRTVNEEQLSPEAEPPTTGTVDATTEVVDVREESESEGGAQEVTAISLSSAEQGEKSEDSEVREIAPAMSETGNELVSNVNCCSNSERASPVLERIIREQEMASPCASSTCSPADRLTVQNQDEDQDVVSLPALVIKVPASVIEPSHTSDVSQAVATSSMSSSGVALSNQTEEEGDADDQVSLPSQISSRSSRSPSTCEEKKRSRVGSRSPLFISLPAHYSSRDKRVIKGPSERFRSHPKGKGKRRKRLTVSLPLPLYWRRCQELNSRKSAVESSPLLVTPITPMVSKKYLKRDACSLVHLPELTPGAENADSAIEKENSSSPPVTLVVSYPLTSVVLSSASPTIPSNVDKIHHSPLEKAIVPMFEMTSAEESSSQILTCNRHYGNQEDTQLGLHPYAALPVESNCDHLLSSPEGLSTRRMQIGGNPLESGGTLKSKMSLDFNLLSGKNTAAMPGVVDVSVSPPVPATHVVFLSPEDYGCDSKTTGSPHVVMIDLTQDSEESDVATGTGVVSETSSVQDHSSGRDKEKQDPEKSMTREEAPERILRKSARLQRGSKAASSGKGGSSKFARSADAETAVHRNPLPQGRKRKRRQSEGSHRNAKDPEHVVTCASSGDDQKKHIDTFPSHVTNKDHTSSRTSILEGLLSKKVKMSLTVDTTHDGHSELDTEAEKSSDVVPESPNEETAPDPDRPSPLPNLKWYLMRSEHSGVPYRVDESPPPEGTVRTIKDSSCLPCLESLLDPTFRRQRKRKSRPPKHILLIKSCGSAAPRASLTSPKIPECPTTKKSAEHSSSCSPLISPLFDENAPKITSIFEQVAKQLSISSSSSNLEGRRTRSNENTCGQHKPRSMPIRSISAEPPSAHDFKPEILHSRNLSKSDPCRRSSLSPTVDEEEPSAARTSIFATAAALKRRRCNESATKKSRSAPPGDIAPPTKKPIPSPAAPDNHGGATLSESRETINQTEQERARKCRSASPIRASKSNRTMTANLKSLLSSQISQSNRKLARDSRKKDSGNCESVNETKDSRAKETKADQSKHSDKDTPSDVILQRKSSAKVDDKKSPTKPAESSSSDQKRELSSHSSVGRSRALSAPSSFPERERDEEVDYDCEREIASHRYSSGSRREVSPSRFRSLPPFSHHHESDHYYHSPHLPLPPPTHHHHSWHHQLSLLGEPPFPHPVLDPPYRGQPHYPPIVSPPPYYHSLPLPLPPPPPPHAGWSHHVSPYGPPPRPPNPYDQRNYR